jgi:hypothetical protein
MVLRAQLLALSLRPMPVRGFFYKHNIVMTGSHRVNSDIGRYLNILYMYQTYQYLWVVLSSSLTGSLIWWVVAVAAAAVTKATVSGQWAVHVGLPLRCRDRRTGWFETRPSSKRWL